MRATVPVIVAPTSISAMSPSPSVGPGVPEPGKSAGPARPTSIEDPAGRAYHRAMEVRRSDDAAAWLDAALPLLLADEARHDLILGIAGTLVRHPSVYTDHRLWIVEQGGDVVGAALQTPPHNLIPSRPTDQDATAALARSIHEDGVRLPGVTGA